mgnify:CR=1 FL=1
MDNRMEDFKNFVKSNPFLIGYIRRGQKSWQDFYEVYDLYGEDEGVWNKYLSEEENRENKSVNNSRGSNYIEEMVRMAKNIDMDKVQEGITSLQKTLLPSRRAAFWFGPNAFKPSASNASTKPAERGASGPTTVNATFFSFANAIKAGKSFSPIATFSVFASFAVPAFPGAT